MKFDLPQLYDAQTGDPVEVPSDQVAEALQSGRFAYEQGAKVPVISPDGIPGFVDAHEAAAAFGSGYQFDSPERQAERAKEAEFGNRPVAASLAGAARGATLGLSDLALTKTGLVEPETLRELEERNPGASLQSEILGSAAPALLSGGTSAPVSGARIGAKALLKATPAALVERAGAAVTKAGERLIGSEGAKTLAQRVLTRAVPRAAGSAVEGAAFGVGQVISDAALGDPNLTAEKALSTVGMSTLIGGGFGLAFGAAAGALAGKGGAAAETQIARHIDDQGAVMSPDAPPLGAAPLDGSIPSSLDQMNVAPEKKADIIEGLTKLKPNSKEIIEAGKVLDAPVLESQISASKHVQDVDSMLMQSPTHVGVARQQLVQKGLDQTEAAVNRTLGEGTELSAAELGETLRTRLTARFEEQRAPISALYDELGERTAAIPVGEKSLSKIAANIRALDDVKLSPSSPEARLANLVADELPNIKTLDDLKRYRTILGRNKAPEVRHMVGVLREKLDDLEESVIKRFARDDMKTDLAKDKVLGILGQMDQAKTGYKALRETMQEFGDVLGKRKIYGPQDFIDFISDIEPEKLTNKLFAKGNARFLKFFSENFPEETQALMTYQKAQLRRAATKDGVVQVGQILRAVDKMTPELRAVMFSPAEDKILRAAKTYYEALPKNINPSMTSKSEAYRRFFTNPLSSAVETARDAGAQAMLTKLVDKTGGKDAPRIQALIALERAARRTSDAVKSAIRGFVKLPAAARKISIPASISILNDINFSGEKYLRAPADKKEAYDKRFDEVAGLMSNPEALTDRITKSLGAILEYAPNIGQAVTETAGRALQFLFDKAPKNPNEGRGVNPLLRKWRPSDSEIARWERYVAAVENPMSVLDDLRQNRVSREGVEALKVVYPAFYGEIVQTLTDQLSDLRQDLPYAKRLQLSVLFDVPIDAAMEPAFVSYMQQLHAQAAEGQPQTARPTAAGMGALSGGRGMMTDTQRLVTRRDI